MLNITDIKIRQVTGDGGKLKAVASVIIDDCFAVHDIKIIAGDQGEFIAMPSRKTPAGDFKDIAHPINSETRAYMRDCILNAYRSDLSEN